MLTVLQTLLPSFIFYRSLTVNLHDKFKDIFLAVRISSTFHSVSTVCCAVLYLSGMLSDDIFVSSVRLLMSGFFTYDIIHILDNYKYYGKTPSQVFIVHHLLGLYGLCYLLPEYLPYVAPTTLLTEVTTPFINLSWYGNKMSGKLKPSWYFVNAVCVLAGFVVFRVGNGTYLMLTGFTSGEYRLGLFQLALLIMNVGWTSKLYKLYLADWRKSKLLR